MATTPQNAHELFNEHRDYLEERLKAQTPIGYFPESAYWIAFDNSLPTYLPLYMRSRFVDLSEMKKVGTLHDHVLFSTGWEWGRFSKRLTISTATCAAVA